MLGSACTTSSKDSDGSADSTTAASGSPGPLRGSARGVTADTIRIGFAFPDLEALSRTGIVKIDTGPAADLMKAIVDDFNSRDTINGRKLALFNSAWFPIGNEKQLAS